MKRQKENYRSRKARKKAMHVRQFGSSNNAPGSVQARRMIGMKSFVDAAKRMLDRATGSKRND